MNYINVKRIGYFLTSSFFILGCPVFNGHHGIKHCIYLKEEGKLRCTIHDPVGTTHQNFYEMPDSVCKKAGLVCDPDVQSEINSKEVSNEVKLCFDAINTDSPLEEKDKSFKNCKNLLQ